MLPITPVLTDLRGSDWEYNAPGSPIKLRPGFEGVDMAPFDLDDFAGVGQPGVTTLGRNDKPNLITLPSRLEAPKGPAARDLLVRWRSGLGRTWALDPDGPLMRFTVRESGKFQMVRLFSADKPDYVRMFDLGWVTDTVKLRSDESWWRTDPIEKTFTAAEFPTAKISNPSDEACWFHARINGPITNPRLGFGGESIPLPPIAIGGWLDIESDPDQWSIVDQSGNDRSWIGNRWHNQVPPRHDEDDIPITISGTNTNSSTKLTITLPQLFWYPL